MKVARKKILLVEDHFLVKKISVMILENLDCDVDAAITGSEALEYCERKTYDLILMDIGLPDIDGLNVIAHIRKHSCLNRATYIVALTAHLDREYMQESYRVGADDFLVKPINYEIGRALLNKQVAIDDTRYA